MERKTSSLCDPMRRADGLTRLALLHKLQ